MKEIVVFKGRKNGIAVLLDDKADFEEIKTALKAKAADARKFFGGAKTPLYFQGRTLTEREENELADVITAEGGLDITFITNFNTPDSPKSDEAAEAPPEKPRGRAPKQTAGQRKPFSDISRSRLDPAQSVVFHRGSMRSGQSIKHEGSVVVVGDVKPGAEVVAGGNVVVLGAAMGVVHAGSLGDSRAFVSALRLMPTQLRISDVITIFPKEAVRNKDELQPSYAYIQNGQIYIEPLE